MYITLSDYYYRKCCKFADQQLSTSADCYRYRGEHRISKMKDDIIVGKMGELAAAQYLKKKGYKPSKPDFTIYERARKSFDADLVTECGKKIHVKSQGAKSVVRYGASWLLQKSDKIIKNATENDYILMVNVDGMKVDVLGVVRVVDIIKENLFEQPKVERYARTKVALYFDSIKHACVDIAAL